MANGRYEEAARVLGTYHSEGDINHPIVALQLKEMQHQISTNASDKKWWSYSGLYNTRSARCRLICVIGMACFGQILGNNVTSYYFPVLAATAYIASSQKLLLLHGIYPVICLFAAVSGARFLDCIGRRPLLMYSLGFCGLSFLAIFAGFKVVADDSSNISGANATLVFAYLFGVVFSCKSYRFSMISRHHLIHCSQSAGLLFSPCISAKLPRPQPEPKVLPWIIFPAVSPALLSSIARVLLLKRLDVIST